MILTKVMDNGEIHLPEQWRKELGIRLGSFVKIKQVGKTLILEPLKK